MCLGKTLVAAALVLSVSLCAVVESTAQAWRGGFGVPPTMPPRPATTAPPESDVAVQPTFRASVEFVEVAVVPTDAHGQFVADLTRDDFELLDRRRRQRIVNFAKVDLPLPMAASGGVSDAELRDTERVDTNEFSEDARLYVLLLDDFHVASERTLRVREQARAFIERYTGTNDLVSIVLTSGRTHALGFSRDRERLLASIEQFTGQKLRSATYDRYVDSRLGGGAALRDNRDPNDGERAYRARVAMATLAHASRVLASTGGRRKSLLYFSEGIDYNAGDIMGKVQRDASPVTHAMADALSSATRGNVTVYAVDPRGLASGDEDAVEQPIYSQTPVVDISEPGRLGELLQSTQSLRGLAEPTGGFAVADVNGIDAAFTRIVRENSSYYVLGYEPSGSAQGGAFRTIDVRVKRKGVTVISRKGYLAPPRDDAALAAPPASGKQPLPELAELLRSVLPVAGLGLRVQAIPFRTGASSTRVHVIVEVDGSQLGFEAKDSRLTERVDLALLTVDHTGSAANGTQATLHLSMKEDGAERVQASGVRWLSSIDLAPGHYQIRVAGSTANLGHRGLTIAEVDVPDLYRPDVAMSGIALTSRPASLASTSGEPWPYALLPGPPTGVRRFVVGDRVTAFAQIYSAAASIELGVPHVTATITATPSGEERPVVVLRSVETDDASLSVESLLLTFDTSSLQAGAYLLALQARASSGHTLVERVVPFELQASGIEHQALSIGH